MKLLFSRALSARLVWTRSCSDANSELYTNQTIQIYPEKVDVTDNIQAIWDSTIQQKPRIKTEAVIVQSLTTDCAISDYGAHEQYELPHYQNTCTLTALAKVIQQNTVAHHHIPTKGSLNISYSTKTCPGTLLE